MESLRQIGAGFLLGVITIAAIIGGFALSRAEGEAAVAVPSPTASPSAIVAVVYPTMPLLMDTPQAIATISITDTPAPSLSLPGSPIAQPLPTYCLPPAGWVVIQTQGYETLSSLAQRYLTTMDAIKRGNCLFGDQVESGSYIYVPYRPTATHVPCGAPYGWGTYFVVAGDTLYNISIRYRVTVADLQQANCMGNSTSIALGKPIRVPNVPTSTSSVKTPTWTVSPTLEVASPTSTPVPPSATASPVPTTEAPPTSPLPTATTQPPPTLTTQQPPTLTTEPPATETPTTPAPSTG